MEVLNKKTLAKALQPCAPWTSGMQCPIPRLARIAPSGWPVLTGLTASGLSVRKISAMLCSLVPGGAGMGLRPDRAIDGLTDLTGEGDDALIAGEGVLAFLIDIEKRQPGLVGGVHIAPAGDH